MHATPKFGIVGASAALLWISSPNDILLLND